MKNTATHIQGVPIKVGMTVYLGDVCLKLHKLDCREGISLLDNRNCSYDIYPNEAIFQLLRTKPHTIPPDPEPCLYDQVEVGQTVWSCVDGDVNISHKDNELIGIIYKDVHGKEVEMYYEKTGHAIGCWMSSPIIYLSRKAYNDYWDAQESKENK